MPELPEVVHAAATARRAATGRIIRRLRLLHRSYQRQIPARRARRLIGDRIAAVDRRGKYQLIRLTSGRTLVVHFRMTGDWEVRRTTNVLPPHTRAAIDFEGGTSLLLVDARALGTLTLTEPGVDPTPQLGPEANEPAFNARWLAGVLDGRETTVKAALLDQAVVAGVGNIYAVEALWFAGLDPRCGAGSLGPAQLRALVKGVKRAMQKALAHPERYYAEGNGARLRFNVYDRKGLPCRRCSSMVRRVVQNGRSTYFCAQCQARTSAN